MRESILRVTSHLYKRNSVWIITVTMAFLQSCSSQASIFRDGDLEREFKESNIEFTLESYKRLIPLSSDGNLFFSPFSISAAMSMVYLGAREQTAKQMVPALSLQSLGHRVHEAYEDYMKVILKGNDDVTLKIANRLYPNSKFPVVPSFLEQCGKHYLADVKAVNFSTEFESARKEINEWVSEQTAKKIENLLPQGSLNPLTVMVLVNAIYFKGNWATQFDKKSTQKQKFHILQGQRKTVDMMFLEETKFPMKRDGNLKCDVLELPYVGDNISMLVVLPEDTLGLSALEGKLTPIILQGLVSDLIPTKVLVYLPKFKLESGFELTDLFKSMGVNDLFDETRANLSGIDAGKATYVSAIFHKAFVDVNEEGTEAAAATAVLKKKRSLPRPPLVFRADHPFLFVIRDNRSGTILFTGRLVDPAPLTGSQPKDEL